MKIKKGTVVRIRRTNQIATVKEIELIRKRLTVHKYCHLETPDGQPDLWMFAEELGEPVENCTVTFSNDTGKVGYVNLSYDHRTGTMHTESRSKAMDYAKEDILPLLLQQFFKKTLRESQQIELTIFE